MERNSGRGSWGRGLGEMLNRLCDKEGTTWPDMSPKSQVRLRREKGETSRTNLLVTTSPQVVCHRAVAGAWTVCGKDYEDAYDYAWSSSSGW